MDAISYSAEELSTIYDTLSFGGIKYFNGINYYNRNNTYFTIITGHPVSRTFYGEHYETGEPISWVETKSQVIGCIELQVSPENSNEVWEKYISVLPEYQGNGYSTKLIEKMIEVMKTHFPTKVLYRSTTSYYCPSFFPGKVDEYLNSAGIKWKQKRLNENSNLVMVKNY